MHRFASPREVRDLVAAGGAVGHDDVVGAGGADGGQERQLGHGLRSLQRLGTVTEGAGHAAARDSIGFTVAPSILRRAASAAGKAPKLFWWQRPWTWSDTPGNAIGAAMPCSARYSVSSRARSIMRSAAGPGSSEPNSSRSVIRHEGSSPSTGASPASASSVRRASARARSTRPAER